MIRYALKCGNGHLFDSWFQSAGAFDSLAGAGRLNCPDCATAEVRKAPMAPAVVAARPPAPVEAPVGPPARATPQAPAGPDREEIAQVLAALRRHVEETSDYVGMNFAAEARRMHAGEAPERSIYGEARPDEARRLIEDGLPVAPLPFVPRRKTN